MNTHGIDHVVITRENYEEIVSLGLHMLEETHSDGHYFEVVRGQDDLAEFLVKKGLARIYTKGEVRPGITTITEGKQRLAGLERQAKNSRAGAWGLKPLK